MTKTLSRRDFLKVTGFVSTSGTALSVTGALEQSFRLFADPQISFGGMLIRGTAQGIILSSKDDGKTWQSLVNFGKQQSITQLEQKNGQLYANLSLDGHQYWLKSLDGKRWLTV